MMFATVDDLDGAVEIVVFEKALAAVEEVVKADEIVLVRGRVDHKEAGKVCIIVQDVERFDPSEKEIEKAKEQVARLAAEAVPNDLRRRVDAARLQPTVIEELRDLFDRYPGRRRVRARDAHAQRHPLPAVRRGVQDRGPQRRADG